MRAAPRSILPMVLSATLLGPLAAYAGETLYNGIVLPDQWPPKIEKLTREPMAVPYLERPPEVIPIDVGRQLFVDDFLIDQTTLQRTYHQATLHPASPVLRPEAGRRWEVSSADKPCAMVFSDGVWYDPTENIFKMWYMGGYTRSVCYATSPDGITWDKPSLDVVPGTNIVLDGSRDSNLVWRDQLEKDPQRAYKMLIVTQRRDERGGVDMAVRYSADGIHWGAPVATAWAGGDRSTLFHNPFRNKWVYSLRHGQDEVGRARKYAECTDLGDGLKRIDEIGRPWTCADRLDPHNPNEALSKIEPQLYNLDAVAYESLIIGLFSIWQGDWAGDLKIPKEKRNEVLLGFTRDGFHWHRPDRRPFVGVNESPGAWNWGNIQTAGGGCLVVGDHLYFYVSGREEDRKKGACATGLAVLRRDGFASMDAGEKTGTLTTRPLVFTGQHLFINADAAGGEIRVEVLAADGKPFDLLTHRRCMPLTTNRTLQPVRWAEAFDLSSVAGKPVRLRFHMTKAKLYSFWVSPDESGASHGYVAAGGPGFTEPRDTIGQAAGQPANRIAASSGQPTSSQPAAALPQTGEDPAKGWVCVTPFGAFPPRDTAEDFVFAGKMWMSNGWTPQPSDPTLNELTRDLWNSADGVAWTRVSESTPYEPYSEMVVYQDKVWAIKQSVWNSADGVNWNRVLEQTPFGGRGYGEAVVFKDRIWQLGSGEDVWSSADGVSWQCATAKAPYGNRACTAVAAFDGKLWLMGGRIEAANDPPEKGYKQFTSYNDVWSSADGENWSCVTEHAPWAPRMWSIATAYAGRLWLIGGYDNRNHRNMADVWTTTDGKQWTQFQSPTQFAPRHEVTPYVFEGSLWVVAGNTWPVVNDVWRLTLLGRPDQ